jgi:hypothetical protein
MDDQVLSTFSNVSPGPTFRARSGRRHRRERHGCRLSDWRDQEAANETILREMSERTEEVADARRLGTGGHPMENYLCDCSDRTCADPITLTGPEPISLTAPSTSPFGRCPVRSAIAGTVASSGGPVLLGSSLHRWIPRRAGSISK